MDCYILDSGFVVHLFVGITGMLLADFLRQPIVVSEPHHSECEEKGIFVPSRISETLEKIGAVLRNVTVLTSYQVRDLVQLAVEMNFTYV